MSSKLWSFLSHTKSKMFKWKEFGSFGKASIFQFYFIISTSILISLSFMICLPLSCYMITFHCHVTETCLHIASSTVFIRNICCSFFFTYILLSSTLSEVCFWVIFSGFQKQTYGKFPVHLCVWSMVKSYQIRDATNFTFSTNRFELKW